MKTILTIGGVLLALALVAYIAIDLFLGSIVKTGVNSFGPKLTGTKVELAGAHISPLNGSGTLSGLAVSNPKGWTDTNAFYLGKIHVDVKPFSVLGDHIVINEIVIEQPQFLYETKVVSSNIGDLMKAIESTTGGSSKDEAIAKNGQPIKFEVKHFRLANGQVKLGVGPAALTLPMPPIELHNVGTKEGGISPNQLAFAVMRSVTTSIVSATTQAAGKLGGTMGAAAGDTAKKASEGLKNLFGGSKK